jgi:hypothetical protein
MEYLLDALEHAYLVLGLEEAAAEDEVFRGLALARIIEPVSKLDSLRVLDEAGAVAASNRTVKRLPGYAEGTWRQRISAACAAHAGLGPASLVLYDVSTLYFQTDTGDGFRSRAFRRSGGWSHRSPPECSPIKMRREHRGEQIPDGHVFTQPWPAGPNGGRRDQAIYYQYRHDRVRRTLRGIDAQVAKAE